MVKCEASEQTLAFVIKFHFEVTLENNIVAESLGGVIIKRSISSMMQTKPRRKKAKAIAVTRQERDIRIALLAGSAANLLLAILLGAGRLAGP